MDNPRAQLQWLMEAGADEAIGEEPVNRLAAGKQKAAAQAEEKKSVSTPPREARSFTTMAPSAAISEARALADKASTLDELEKAVREFEGCALKKVATHTVFAEGARTAKVMLIGEAPGAQEDQQGIPFCGPSGMLLDKMLASIGLSRKENIYITNTLFWRPPGNRQPSKEELAICEPFVEKHIALLNPKLLILCGGTAAVSMLKKETSISRLRTKLHEYSNGYLDQPVQSTVLFHPSYLLRSPGQKRLAWHDLLFMEKYLQQQGVL